MLKFTVFKINENLLLLKERIYNEVIETMGSDRLPEPADMSKLLFTERFIKEVLRLFPVGPYYSRQTDADVDLGK